MSEYIDIPEAFTERRSLCKSRYRIRETGDLVYFDREFWNGSAWERSPFSDGITIPLCVASEVAAALEKRSNG